LRTRSVKYKHLLEITALGGKGKVQPIKRPKFQSTSQRAWAYLEEPATPQLFTSSPYPKGKGTGKGKSKGGKGKGFGKGLGKGKPSFVPKGKGKGKGKGKLKGKPKGGKGKQTPKGNLFPRGPFLAGCTCFPGRLYMHCRCPVSGFSSEASSIDEIARGWLGCPWRESWFHVRQLVNLLARSRMKKKTEKPGVRSFVEN
jgi:hypothetical protein